MGLYRRNEVFNEGIVHVGLEREFSVKGGEL